MERINYFLLLSYLNYWETVYRVWLVILKISIRMTRHESYLVEASSRIHIEEMSLDCDSNWLLAATLKLLGSLKGYLQIYVPIISPALDTCKNHKTCAVFKEHEIQSSSDIFLSYQHWKLRYLYSNRFKQQIDRLKNCTVEVILL